MQIGLVSALSLLCLKCGIRRLSAMSVKISILVPVYNVEAYLRQCLDSIKAQNFQDFEVLCINDGSTDGSPEIIKSFVEKDSRFKLINKPNGGYGQAMNMGLAQACGKYIGIVESDDYIEPQMFARLYAIAEEFDLDIARCNYYKLAGGEKHKEDLHYIPANKLVCPLEEPVIFYQAPAIWANLYRAALMRDNGIKFLETPGASYQDTSFAFKAYAFCRRFMFIDEPLLNYRLDNPDSSVKAKSKVFAVCEEQAEILAFAKKHDNIYSKMKEHIPVLRYACYAWNYGRIDKKFRPGFLKEWGREIRADYREGRINKAVISRKRRKRMWFIANFPFIYKWRRRGL